MEGDGQRKADLLGFGEERKLVRWQWPWFAFECTASLVCTILSLSQEEERLASGSGRVEFVTWDVALWISDLLFHWGRRCLGHKREECVHRQVSALLP